MKKTHGCISPCRHFSQHSSEFSYDLVVLGGGIVGLATAREVALRHPAMKIALVEKERKLGVCMGLIWIPGNLFLPSSLASHQTGHNSGVIHTGIYYTPGSLKAKLCVKGAEMMYDYCDKHNVPHKTCGKVMPTATTQSTLTNIRTYKLISSSN